MALTFRYNRSADATVRIWPGSPKANRNNDEHVDKKAKTSDNVVVMSIPSSFPKKRGVNGNKPPESMVVDLEWNVRNIYVFFLSISTHESLRQLDRSSPQDPTMEKHIRGVRKDN